MRNRSLVFLGVVIVAIGVVWLLSAVFDIDMGKLCLPAALILIGVYIIARRTVIDPDTPLHLALFGPVSRGSDWQVADDEIALFIGDVRLDLAEAQIPIGETQLKIWRFIGNVRIRVPAGVGVSIDSIAVVSTVRGLGAKRESFVAPAHLESEGYETAERKVHLELFAFISEARAELA